MTTTTRPRSRDPASSLPIATGFNAMNLKSACACCWMQWEAVCLGCKTFYCQLHWAEHTEWLQRPILPPVLEERATVAAAGVPALVPVTRPRTTAAELVSTTPKTVRLDHFALLRPLVLPSI